MQTIQIVPQPIVDGLTNLTGLEPVGYTVPDIFAVVISIICLLYAVYRGRPSTNRNIGILIGVIGALLLSWRYTRGGNILLMAEGGISILAGVSVSIILSRVKLIRSESSLLLVSLSVILSIYPIFIVFPIQESLLPNPFETFILSILTYTALVAGLAVLAKSIIGHLKGHNNPIIHSLTETIKVENLSDTDTIIWKNSKGNIGLFNAIRTENINDYVNWEGEDSLKDIDEIDIKSFLLDSYSEELRESDVDEIANAMCREIEWIKDLDVVTIYSFPIRSEQLLLIGTILAIIFGDLVYLLPSIIF